MASVSKSPALSVTPPMSGRTSRRTSCLGDGPLAVGGMMTSRRSTPCSDEMNICKFDSERLSGVSTSIGTPITTSTMSSRSSSVSRDICSLAATFNLRQVSQARRRIGIPLEDSRQPPSQMSTEELMADLEGQNGKWKRLKAKEEMERREQEQAKLELQRKLEDELLRQQRQQDEGFLRRQRAQERVMAWTRMANRCLQREEARHTAIAEAAEQERKRQLDAQMQRLREPIACPMCTGSGKCGECDGLGCLPSLYLSAHRDSRAFNGRALNACEACGGTRSGTEELGFPTTRKGTGKCTNCCGAGKIVRPDSEIRAFLQFAGTPETR